MQAERTLTAVIVLLVVLMYSTTHGQLCPSKQDFEQEICGHEENVTMSAQMFPSWCSNSNPFSTPFLFSDVDFPPETRNALCVGNDPMSDCFNVKQIRSLELSNGFRFMLLSTVRGTIYSLNFNTDTVTYIASAAGSTVDQMEVLVNDTAGSLLTRTDRTVRMFYGRFPDIEFHLCWSLALNETEVDTILHQEIFDSNNKTYFSILVRNKLPTLPPYQLKVFPFTGCELVDNTTIPAAIWNIYNATGTPGMRLFTQSGKFLDSILVSISTESRKLFVLYDEREVKIVAFIPEHGRNEFDLIFNGTSVEQKYSHFYTLEDNGMQNVLTTVELMGAGLRRIDFTKSNCSHIVAPPSQEVYLVMTIWSTRYRVSTLLTVSLFEFEQYDIDHPATDPLNPVNRTVICPNSPEYFNIISQKCEAPLTYSNPLPSKVKQSSVKFINIPEEFNSINSIAGGKVNIEFLCELIATKGWFSRDQFTECMTFANTTKCEVDALKRMIVDDSLSFGINYALSKFWLSQIFLSTEEQTVIIYGAQQEICTEHALLVREFNEISFIGSIQDIHASENGEHLFVTVSRKLWELQAVERYEQICTLLLEDPDNPFLKPYKESCTNTPPQPTDLNQYGQYVSACFSGTYCPSLLRTKIEQVPSKYYTLRPNQMHICPQNYFCQQGVRQPCPIGYQCPQEGLELPIRCDRDRNLNSTCYGNGLASPQPCPDGALCIAPYFPPLPISPGSYLKIAENGTREIAACSRGEWCSLGRFANENTTDLLCPAVFVCETPDVIVPKMCNCSEAGCDYCPAGSFEEKPCVAGYYCTRPDNIVECNRGEWCPPGTVVPAPCPEGYYCPHPAEKLICPRRHYCVKGSIVPHPCSFLSYCREGSYTSHSEIIGGITYFLLVVGLVAVYLGFKFGSQWCRGNGSDKAKDHAKRSPFVTSKDGLVKRKFNINFKFENLGLKLKTNGAKVLDSVTGKISSGELTAVMGLSGCGKSTFVTTLAGRAYYGNQIGKIYINGKEDSLTKYEKLVGFVPQEDIMLRTMTVEEVLYFSARTRLDMFKSRKEIREIVDRVISLLGLKEIRHSFIGDESVRGISGGQRKRVNIGMELVADPCALFLDEPTSGLDSSSSFEVCQALRDIATSGMTVVTVIHQPRYEIFKMFHTVLLLGKGGRVVYLGPSDKVLDYFESLGFTCGQHVNPPDFFMDIINGDVPREGHPNFKPSDLFELWEQNKHLVDPSVLASNDDSESIEADFVVIEENASSVLKSDVPMVSLKEEYKTRRRSMIIQFIECVKRAAVQQIRDMSGFFLDNFLVFLAGLFLGMIFNNAEYVGPLPKVVQNQCPSPLKIVCELPLDDPLINMASLMPLSLGLTGVMASLSTFGKDQVVFLRENQSGLSSLAYFLARSVMTIPHLLTAPLVFLCIFTSIYSPRAPTVQYYGLLLLMHFAAYGFGQLVSLALRESLTQLAGVVMILVFQLLAGARPTIPQMQKMFFPLPYLHYFSYIAYGQEALYLIEISHYKEIYDVKRGMEVFGYKFSDFGFCVGMIAVIGVLVRVAAYLLLATKRPDSFVQQAISMVVDVNAHASRVKDVANKVKQVNWKRVATTENKQQKEDDASERIPILSKE